METERLIVMTVCRVYCNYSVNIRTHLLTAWSRFLLEKLMCSQLVKNFASFYKTRRFINAFRSVRHLSISWARSIQSIPPPTICKSILIIPSEHGPFKFCLSLNFPHQEPVYNSPVPHMCYIFRPSHCSRFDHSKDSGEEYRSLSSSLRSFIHTLLPCSLRPKYSPQHPILKHPPPTFSPQCERQSFTPVQNNRKFLVLYMLIFILLDRKLEDKRFCTDIQQAFPDFDLLLISSWMKFWSVKFFPKYLNCSALSN